MPARLLLLLLRLLYFHRYGIPVVPAFNMSVPLHDAHVGKVLTPGGDIDCIHYCHPGVPEVRFVTSVLLGG
jgi:hypothetical protein